MPDNIFFNAHHAPIGAFATFTLGFPGAKGGLGLELGRPADQNVYIGVESDAPGVFQALPFFGAGLDGERARYEVDSAPPRTAGGREVRLTPFGRGAIARSFALTTDTWTAGPLAFCVYSPVCPVPDPDTARVDELQRVLVPAVVAELTVDNRQGKTARRAFLGYQGNDPYSAMRRLDDVMGRPFAGVGQGRHTAIVSADEGVQSGLEFTLEGLLRTRLADNLGFGLGGVGALLMDAPPGQTCTWRVAICFHRGGVVTAGLDAAYYYTRFFPDIEAVARYALEHFGELKAQAVAGNALLDEAPLSAPQRFMLAHAVRSYYGSTELLECDGRPLWVVNEGEYRMMNTFDLTADHLFYEMRMNPWTVRNVLDLFVRRYSYRDRVRLPGEAAEQPGGLSFTHDMGIANGFARPGRSAYELGGLTGCFSHMTHEQLANWLCCATVYAHRTGDRAWVAANLPVFRDCLQSLLRRDHPDPARRTGVMKRDSSRTEGGAEITTYDSLDASLGQARNNLYLAVKCWAAYVALETLFGEHGEPALAREAGAQARRSATTLVAHVTAAGYIPAVMDEGNDSKIIPAVEGLAFAWHAGRREAVALDGPYGPLMQALRRHLEAVLVPGVCLFPDGGWKISSTSDNSWLSKIYLCQFVAHRILGLPRDGRDTRGDAAHVQWLLHPELSYWSWSDQIVAGAITGSKYYPRGVTSILWLEEAAPLPCYPCVTEKV
jgi:hypothetical protein